MENNLQDGIFYNKNQRAGNSFAVIFLRVSKASTADQLGTLLKELWYMYEELKKGIQSDLKEINEKRRYSGNLEVLIGYSARVFSVKGCRRQMPVGLEDEIFNEPFAGGGGPIVKDSSILYANDIRMNHVASEHILLQFIGDDTLTVTRAIVETWKLLSTFRDKDNDFILSISKCYEGFQRNDGRSWLGFHDGVSNIPSRERLKTISISHQGLFSNDLWTANGTYLCFMRIVIDLCKWQRVEKEVQELIIGRDKISGCPVIGKDMKGKPIKAPNCPIKGTFEVIEPGNEMFRDYQPSVNSYQLSSSNADLKFSHIARAKIPNRPYQLNNPKVYRQGFEFFESIDSFPGFNVGLNFISYQNTTSNLFKILQEGFSRNYPSEKEFKSFEDYFTVSAAGIFLVPPKEHNELFPGMSIFLDINKIIPKSHEYRKSRYNR
jgi:Dyp-type peroxidase family